jgi:phosphatidylinositol kinase/protein kinase (PI-3  family)
MECGEKGIEGALKRIREKMVGEEFGGDGMSAEAQTARLIESAIDMYNLAHLYHGWTPLW